LSSNISAAYEDRYHDGTLKAKGNISSSGTKEGKWQYWYSNGSLISEGYYKNNLRHGEWAYHDREGRVTAVKEFRNGKEVSQGELEAATASSVSKVEKRSPITSKPEPSVVATEEEFKRAAPEKTKGKSYGDGSMLTESYYSDGKYYVTWTYWGAEGNINTIREFINGKEVKKKRFVRKKIEVKPDIEEIEEPEENYETVMEERVEPVTKHVPFTTKPGRPALSETAPVVKEDRMPEKEAQELTEGPVINNKVEKAGDKSDEFFWRDKHAYPRKKIFRSSPD